MRRLGLERLQDFGFKQPLYPSQTSYLNRVGFGPQVNPQPRFKPCKPEAATGASQVLDVVRMTAFCVTGHPVLEHSPSFVAQYYMSIEALAHGILKTKLRQNTIPIVKTPILTAPNLAITWVPFPTSVPFQEVPLERRACRTSPRSCLVPGCTVVAAKKIGI